MSVKISFEMDTLKDQAVTEALAQLLRILGRSSVAMEGLKSGSQPSISEGFTPAPLLSVAAQEPSTAMPAPRRSRTPRPPEPIDPNLTEAERYEKFVEHLPERSRRFLELVKKKGTLQIKDAMEELGIDVPKAMGGITGSIGRWAPVRHVKVPYEAIIQNGDRAWRWIDSSEEEQPPENPQEEQESTAKAEEKDPSLQDLLEHLPASSQRFLSLLENRGSLLMTEVLNIFGLARAKAVGGITEPIVRISREMGFPMPYTTSATDAGERLWEWPGAQKKEESSVEKPKVEPLKETRPGVRVRKRKI